MLIKHNDDLFSNISGIMHCALSKERLINKRIINDAEDNVYSCTEQKKIREHECELHLTRSFDILCCRAPSTASSKVLARMFILVRNHVVVGPMAVAARDQVIATEPVWRT